MKTLFNIFIIIVFISCSNEDDDNVNNYVPTPISINIPPLFEQKILPPNIPFSNPQTQEGVDLGKKLFFDKKLSSDNSQSCATCHSPNNSFSSKTQFSEGVDGVLGNRNAMPLINLVFNYDDFFAWDGSEFTLENQALEPVENPIEMHNSWAKVVDDLQNTSVYPNLFNQAFGTSIVTKELITKAIAQFERTLISGNSKFDRYLLGQDVLSDQEQRGFNVFMDEAKGDCFHCHGSNNNPLWTDNKFHNNGLDAVFSDLGLGGVTGDPSDNGKFKTPTLRNLIYTAPYMHDGRFQTLDQVINHYSEGLKNSPTIDPLMKKVSLGGVGLSEIDKLALKAFLLTLIDQEFIDNPSFRE